MDIERELRALRLFSEKARKLSGLSFTKRLMDEDSGFRISFDHEKGMTAERHGPSEESIDAFVLTLRFFMQNNETCSIHNMTGHIAKLHTDGLIPDEIASNWDMARDAINAFLDTPTFFIEKWERADVPVREERYTHKRIVDVFVYGELAHSRDVEKKKLIDNWRTKPEIFSVVESLFVEAIGNLVYGLDAMRRHIIDPAIEEIEARTSAT